MMQLTIPECDNGRMRAITVRQPYASQIASGQKTIELRTWRTHYRGELLICAAAKSHQGLPTGVALCIVRLLDCRPMRHEDEVASMSSYRPETWSWILEMVRTVEPFPVSGKLSLYEVALPANV